MLVSASMAKRGGPEPGLAAQRGTCATGDPDERSDPRLGVREGALGWEDLAGRLASELQRVGEFRESWRWQEEGEGGHARRAAVLHPIGEAGSGGTVALRRGLHAVGGGPTQEGGDRGRSSGPAGEDEALGH